MLFVFVTTGRATSRAVHLNLRALPLLFGYSRFEIVSGRPDRRAGGDWLQRGGAFEALNEQPPVGTT